MEIAEWKEGVLVIIIVMLVIIFGWREIKNNRRDIVITKETENHVAMKSELEEMKQKFTLREQEWIDLIQSLKTQIREEEEHVNALVERQKITNGDITYGNTTRSNNRGGEESGKMVASRIRKTRGISQCIAHIKQYAIDAVKGALGKTL